MKHLLLTISFFALLLASCTTTNNPVTNIYVVDSIHPTITGFSPDTVWTFGTLTIYGTHFGYNPTELRVSIDSTVTYADSVVDTMMKIHVEENAQTGPIRVSTINGFATSARAVTVESTFHPHSIDDSLTAGASFSIPGTGMNHARGIVSLTVGGIPYPIDSIFPNRIVSHITPIAISGDIVLSDSSATYPAGQITLIRHSAWNTLSLIWDNLTVTETHQRIGYVNGPANPIDSTWKTIVTYVGQRDVNVSGIDFLTSSGDLEYNLDTPYLYLYWDTIDQSAGIRFQLTASSSATPLQTIDTNWAYMGTNLTTSFPVDDDIEFTIPGNGYSYSITEHTVDAQGLVNWQESTTTSPFVSGSFDLILKR